MSSPNAGAEITKVCDRIKTILINIYLQISAGAYNDNEEEEGKGKSAKRPRERLIFPR
jgi:hypothetical protein